MPALTFRGVNAVVNNYQELAEADQGAGFYTGNTGWIVAKNASPLSSEMDVGVEQAGNTFSDNTVTAKPSALLTGASANAFRTLNPYTGEFANTNWSIVIAWRSVTAAHTGTVRIRCRVFASTDATGATSVRELTGSTQVGSTSATGSTTADVTSTVTWAPGGIISLNNEYLFFALAMEVVTASGGNTQDADLRTGTSTTGTRIVTPIFSGVEAATISSVSTPSFTEVIPPEAATIAGVTSVSTNEVYTAGGTQYTESATVGSVTTPSATESADYVESFIVSGVTTPSATETADYVGAATIPSVTTPSSTETTDFSDSATCAAVTSISASEAVVRYQHAYPISDIASTGWSASAGAVPLYTMIDDPDSPDDTDYIYATAT